MTPFKPSRSLIALLLCLLLPGYAFSQQSFVETFPNTVNQSMLTTLEGWAWAASDGGGSDTGGRQYGRMSNANGVDGQPGIAYNYSQHERAVLTWYTGSELGAGIPTDLLESFSLRVGHNNANVETRFVLRVADHGWFVTTARWSGNVVGDPNNFQTEAALVEFNFTTSGNAWRFLEFDGNTGSNSEGFAVFSGEQAGMDDVLPAGLVTAIGVYHFHPASGVSRYDDFRVSWNSFPDDGGPRFSVTYHANGGVGAVPVDIVGPYPADWPVSVAGPGVLTRVGHAFTGWNTEPDGTGTSLTPGETFPMPEEDLTLYAQWVELETGDRFFQTARPYAEFYDADGNGQRDGRVPLPFPATLEMTLDFSQDASNGRRELRASRHFLDSPLRVFLEESEDFENWHSRTFPLDEPSDQDGEKETVPMAPGSADRLFFRTVAADARILQELTPESARNLWARLMAGALTVMNEAGTHGNGTRGADPQGRVFGTDDYELVLRTLWSLGGWFYHPDRPATLDWVNPLDGSGGTVDLAAFARNAIRNGADPAHPQSWPQSFQGGNLSTMQPSVEAGNLAWTAWALQRGAAAGNEASPWSQLSPGDRTNLQNWLALHGNVPNSGSVNHGNIYNWNLFFVLNHEARKRLGAAGYPEFSWTQAQIDGGRAAVDELHRGLGWYSDYTAFDIFDDYIHWTFATHLLLQAHMGAHEPDAATQIPGRPAGRTRAAILAELRHFLALTPYAYDLEGGHTEDGRSTTYKVSRLSGLLIAYAVDSLAQREAPDTWTEPAFPPEISPGQLRRLVRLHLNHFLRNETFHWPSGLLREGITADTPVELLEFYSVRGSTYWNMILFAGLWLIPDDDPFWSEPEEPLPAQVSDFALWLETPRWFLTHVRDRGDIRKYPLRSAYRTDAWAETSYHPKYAKFAYSSRFGHLLPAATRGDQMIRIGNRERRLNDHGDIWPVDHADGEGPHVLRTLHTQGNWQISTLVFLRGALDVRVHRITGPGGTETITDGGFPLGHATGEPLTPVQTGDDWMYTESSRGAILHAALLGFTEVKYFEGTGNHSRDPAWRRMWAEAAEVNPQGLYATLQVAKATSFESATMRAKVQEVTATNQTATVRFQDGMKLTAPFLDEEGGK